MMKNIYIWKYRFLYRGEFTKEYLKFYLFVVLSKFRFDRKEGNKMYVSQRRKVD